MPTPVAPTAYVRSESGELGTVPAEQLQAAVRQGYVHVADEDARAEELQAEYGGVGGTVAAAALGGISGLSLGLSNPAAVEGARLLGGDSLAESTRAGLAGYKEANPIASGAGELVGMAAPLLASGGASAGATALRTAGALPRGVALLGRAAESGAAKLIGEGAATLGGRALARAVPLAVQGAVEGSIYGAGQVLSEEALTGDYSKTAEHLLAGIGHTALMAGALGGVLGAGIGAAEYGASKLLGRLKGEANAVRSIADTAPTVQPDFATSTISEGQELADRIATQAAQAPNSVDSAAERYISARYAQQPEQAELMRKAYRQRVTTLHEQADAMEAAERELTAAGTEVLRAERALGQATFGDAKAEQMAALVEPKNWTQARDVALNVWQDATDVVAVLKADPTRGGAGVSVSKIEAYLKKMGDRIGQAANPKNPTAARDLFMAVDDFKRAVGKGAQYGKGPFGLTEAAREFDELYQRIIPKLEDAGVWGKAGEAQAEYNKAVSNALGTSDSFKRNFVTNYDSSMGRPLFEFDPADTHSFLSAMGEARNDLRAKSLADWVSGMRERIAVAEKHYKFSAAESAQLAQGRKALDKMERTLADTAERVQTIGAIKRIQAEEQASGIGGVVGTVTDLFSRPLTTINRLGAMRRAADRVATGVDSAARAVAKGGHSAKSAGGASESIASKRAEFSKRVEAVQEAAASPERAVERISTAIQAVQDVAPKTAAALAVSAMRATAYLAAKIPAGVTDNRGLTPQLNKPMVSDAQVASFARTVAAVDDPLTVLEDIKNRRATREGVEALKTVYPKIFADVQVRVMDELTKRTTPLAYQDAVQIALLFDVPAHASLTPSFITAMQTPSAPVAKPKMGNMDISADVAQTGTGRLEAR